MPLRQVQAHEAPRRRLRQVRRRGDQVEGPPRADGAHRAGLAGLPRLVLQGASVANRASARHLAAGPGADSLLRVLRRDRSRRDGPVGKRAALRGTLPGAARGVRRRVRRENGRAGHQGAAAESGRGHAGRRAAHDHEDRDLADQTPEGGQAPQGLRRVPALRPPARLDDPGCHPGHSTRAATARAAGWRTFCDFGSERPLPAGHQPQQPVEEAARAAGTGSHRAQREAPTTGP